MSMLSRIAGALAAVLVLVATLTGCGGDDVAPRVTKPTVRADGSYRVGSVGDAESKAAIQAAVDALPTALSYDYRSLDTSLKAATKQMTSSFAETFTRTFDTTTRPMAGEKQAITSALVRAAGLVGRIRDDKATVLIYLDQVLISSRTKKATDPLKVSQNRVHVKLRKVDGAWKVDDIVPF